ncbi:hypothetical protein [Streptomyces sp. NPDC001568]|uniref:hypothetical protein n=1 Tax=Streptomyces sp. NPDC001568 TaxID=3364588 RepID=UPI00369FD532
MSVFQPRDPLKEAVAAWVATAEPAEPARKAGAAAGKGGPESGAEPGDGTSADGGDAAAGADETQAFEAVPDAQPSPGRVDSPAAPSKLAGLVRQSAPAEADRKSGSAATDDADGADGADGADADADAGADKPGVTAFGVARSGSASKSGAGSASAAGAASGTGSRGASEEARGGSEESARDGRAADKPATTAFGVVKSGPAKEDGQADESERTAVFRAPKVDSASGTGAAAANKPEVTAFGVVKSGSGSASGADRDGAGKPARDARTTAFGVVKPEQKPDAGSGAEPDAEPDAGPGATPAAADSERTAVFRAVKSDSAPPAASEAPARSTASADAAKGAAGSKDTDAAENTRNGGSDSERTAVFRAVKPDSAPPAPGKTPPAAPDSERTAVFRTVKPDSAPPAPGKTPPAAPDSERTAVFRAVKPDSAPPAGPGRPASAADGPKKPATDAKDPKDPKDPKGAAGPKDPADAPGTKADGPAAGEGKGADRPAGGKGAPGPTDGKRPGGAGSDNERTAVFRAVKPGGAPPAPAGDAAKAAGERASSTFVPLRGDLPAPPKPTPAAGPPAPPKPAPTHPAAPEPATQAPAAPAAAAAAATANRLDSSERTTQQPLPPRPPLDMLADLTNNPPPPPSPLRTAVRRFKIYAPIVLLLAVVLAVVQLVRPLPAPKLALTAQSSYTFPGGKPDLPWPTEGQASMAAAGLGTIGSSGEQKPVPIASVTKSMTAYIILRDHPFKKGEKGAMIDIDKTAETEGQKDKSDNESTLNTVKEGDKISTYDAIAALMIPSANNIARLLARWDAGSQEAFVKKMNDTAKELGMTNTTYTDPSGLDATTVSTAEDQVKLGLKIVEMDALLDITRKPSWVDPYGKTWPNWNRLVPANDSLGIKTGTTTKAGGNLLFAAQKKVGGTNQLIVGAVLGQHKPPIIDSVIAASRTLLIATQKSLEGAPVVKKGDVVGYVDDGLGGRTPVVATADVQAVGWSSLTVDIKLGDGGAKLPGTAKAGTEVGVLTVGDGASQVKVPVALKTELATPGIGSKLVRVG